MRLEVIREKLQKIIVDYNLEINSIKPKREFGEKILEILLKGKDINTDVLSEIHLKLYESLEDGDLNDDYFLELSSVGAEYPLNTLEEVKDHVGSYVLMDAKKFKDYGYIIDVTDNVITIEYNAKGQFRKIKIEYDDVLKLRTSVKF